MKKRIALILMATICLALMSACFVGCSLVDNANYTTTNHVVDSFDNIYIDVNIADVIVKKATNEKYTVSCFETDKIRHKVTVENGTLKIIAETDSVILPTYNILKTLTVTVFLPEKDFGTLSIETDTGNISIDAGLNFENATISTDTGVTNCSANVSSVLKIESDTGNIDLDNIKDVTRIELDSDTGSVSLDNISCNSIEIDTNTGNVKFACLKAQSITINTDTGNINGSVVGPMTFETHTDIGTVSVPNSEAGGICNVSSNIGDIKITLCN